MTQRWHNLLFAHWPVPTDELQPLIPPSLQLDTCEGQAWVGVIAFRLSGIRLRGLPEMPFVARFPEINVRTYVRAREKPGVLFLSLDADNPFAIALARPWFRLPYHPARIRFRQEHGGVSFKSTRRERGAVEASFSAHYRPCGQASTAPDGTLENWLTERYCYYAGGSGRGGRLYRCDIHHAPWRLWRVQAKIGDNTMALSHGIHLPQCQPHLLYSHRMEALVWPLAGVPREGREGACRRHASCVPS